ncbi:hypothetical protein SAMN04488570_1500 [Nocardioides scoriae]|uniref:Fenitrothion hydrolase n=1 Tax=Nocardioides scoriae TaxID=642780 RepID=A0A1H1QTM8_9ACTN|nr:hypothetical protein [Nocardioides scoriae]SDS26804.1 hypothetical protein SAMN04488570_1500 [Nocardioides scoriae]
MPGLLVPLPLHGLGGAQNLPLPLPLAVAGATAALVVSFCVLALAWRRPRYVGGAPSRPAPAALARVVDGAAWAWTWRVLGLLFFGYLVWPLVAGPDLVTNPVLGTFYVLVWVGVVPASLLLGRAARAVSPVRTLNLLLARLTGGDPARGLAAYPERLGLWPAALGLFAFVWQELVNPQSAYVGSVRVWLAVYLAAMVVGALVFGDTWLSRADPFEVWSDLLAHLSPWGRDDAGRLVVRSPLSNLATVVPRPGLLAVVAVLFGSTAFDSYKDTLFWQRLVADSGLPAVPVDTAALLVFCLVVGGSFTVAARLTGVETGARTGRGSARVASRRELPLLLAHSVVPIAVGYLTAHYLTYFVEQGQTTLMQLSDPLVRGDDLLGTADWSVSYWLSFHPTLLAVVKVLAIVLGHVVGVVAAHDRALSLLPARHHVTGQLAMLVVMVVYTATGLYLLMAS